ncbi:hypothetical protein [Methylotuvimicrobium sp. KM1]
MMNEKKPVKQLPTLPAGWVNYLAAQGFLAAQGLRAEQGFC